MDKSEFYSFENRNYIQPTLSSGEQEKFIDNLRDIQKQNTQQIQQQTQALGTNVPSNLGGLGGGESYFTSRYQTPQVNEMVDTLKSAAKAQELNDVMKNYQAQLKNRYTQAKRNYDERQRDKLNNLLNGNVNGNIKTKVANGDVSIWDSPSYSDDVAYYGLNKLTRNAGESDAQWQARVKAWAAKNALYNKTSGGKIRPSFGMSTSDYSDLSSQAASKKAPKKEMNIFERIADGWNILTGGNNSGSSW